MASREPPQYPPEDQRDQEPVPLHRPASVTFSVLRAAVRMSAPFHAVKLTTVLGPSTDLKLCEPWDPEPLLLHGRLAIARDASLPLET